MLVYYSYIIIELGISLTYSSMFTNNYPRIIANFIIRRYFSIIFASIRSIIFRFIL